MNRINAFFSNEWADALGWTLLHSLWQSLLILLIVTAILRFIPAVRSSVRYGILCGGLSLFAFTAVATFLFLNVEEKTEITSTVSVNRIYSAEDISVRPFQAQPVTTQITTTIHHNMPLILGVWIVGALFFLVRLTSGLIYTSRLKSTAVTIDDGWSEYLKVAGEKLGIQKLVSLAAASSISTPMVIGYFKPVILVPVGMLTGLTTEQLETIFLHELAHIKRHDYLINLVQAVLETLFFFNPFLWILSSLIRREREYCCDDLVIAQHGGKKAYAHALAQLAEARLSSVGFALSLGSDNNQLLKRIRRIMERSVNYQGKSRLIVPVIVLTASLFCISWLGMDGHNRDRGDLQVKQDTVPDKKQNQARYTRKRIITIDENGQPHEEIVEEFEGDEDLRPLLQNPVPSIPDISVTPPVPNIHVVPPIPDLLLPAPMDTVPRSFGFRNHEELRKLNDELQKQFEDLLTMREWDPEKLMEDLEQKFGWREWQDWDTLFENNFPHDSLNHSFRGFNDAESFQDLEEQLQRFRDLNFENFRHLQKGFERNESSLREQLVEDGYLSEDETIEGLEWSDDTFKVNGKEIKEKDREKYKALSDRYLNGGS